MERKPPELAILIGVQASGKSSFYRERLSRTHLHVSKDLMSRSAKNKDARQSRLIEEALAEGRSVALDNTSPSRQVRAPLIQLGKAHGARVVAYSFKPDLEKCLKRNAARSARARVPDVALHVTHQAFEPPIPEEGFDVIYEAELGREPRVLFSRVDVPEKTGS